MKLTKLLGNAAELYSTALADHRDLVRAAKERVVPPEKYEEDADATAFEEGLKQAAKAYSNTSDMPAWLNALTKFTKLTERENQGDGEFAARALDLALQMTAAETNALTDENEELAKGLGELPRVESAVASDDDDGDESGDESVHEDNESSDEDAQLNSTALQRRPTAPAQATDGASTVLAGVSGAPTDCPDVSRYTKLQAFGLPDEQVMLRMKGDGVDPKCKFPSYTESKPKMPKPGTNPSGNKATNAKPAGKPSLAQSLALKLQRRAKNGNVDVNEQVNAQEQANRAVTNTSGGNPMLAAISGFKKKIDPCNTEPGDKPTDIPTDCKDNLKRAVFKYTHKDSLEAKSKLTKRERKQLCERNTDPNAFKWAECADLPSALERSRRTAMEKAQTAAEDDAGASQRAVHYYKELLARHEERYTTAKKKVDELQEAPENGPTGDDDTKAQLSLPEAQKELYMSQHGMQQVQQSLREAEKTLAQAVKAAAAAKKIAAVKPLGEGGSTNGINALLDMRREAIADDSDEDGSDSSSEWVDDGGGGGGGASDDEDEGVDDVFEPALQRLLISMLLKNRRLSAADCVRRICACDFSGCQFPCLREQQLVRGFVQYPFYRDAVHHAVHRLHPLLKPRF